MYGEHARMRGEEVERCDVCTHVTRTCTLETIRRISSVRSLASIGYILGNKIER